MSVICMSGAEVYPVQTEHKGRDRTRYDELMRAEEGVYAEHIASSARIYRAHKLDRSACMPSEMIDNTMLRACGRTGRY